MYKIRLAIAAAFGLWMAYDLGKSHGMRQIDNYYATDRCIGELTRSINIWQKAINFALSPASGVELATQERREVSNMFFYLSDRNKLPVVEKVCKEEIEESGPSPTYEFGEFADNRLPLYLSYSTRLKIQPIMVRIKREQSPG